MKSDKLMEAMNEIDDKYIMEAHEPITQPSKIKQYWKPVVTSVLCTCAAFMIIPSIFSTNYNADTGYSSAKCEERSDVSMKNKMNLYDDSQMDYEVQEDYEQAEEKAVVETGEKQIITAYLDIETMDLDKVTQEIDSQVEAFQGYVQYSNFYKEYTNQRVYSATIRIPADQFEAFVEKMKETGNVISYSQSIEDVTDSYFDVQVHIDSLNAEKEKVEEFYKKAETVEELTVVEQRLSEIEYQLNSYQAQLKNYDTLTTYSTLTITVTETKEYTETKDDFISRLGNSFATGWSHFVSGVEELVIFFVYNIWSILALVLLGFGGYKGYKIWKKK